MEIYIKQKGEDMLVDVHFEAGLAGKRYITLKYPTSDAAWAGLLAEAIEAQFDEHVNKIRKYAYEKGWQDKTKRNRKETFFDYCPNFIKF